MARKNSIGDEIGRLILDGLKKAHKVTIALTLSRWADGNGATANITRRLYQGKPSRAKVRR